jgi:hypothetical protein
MSDSGSREDGRKSMITCSSRGALSWRRPWRARGRSRGGEWWRRRLLGRGFETWRAQGVHAVVRAWSAGRHPARQTSSHHPSLPASRERRTSVRKAGPAWLAASWPPSSAVWTREAKCSGIADGHGPAASRPSPPAPTPCQARSCRRRCRPAGKPRWAPRRGAERRQAPGIARRATWRAERRPRPPGRHGELRDSLVLLNLLAVRQDGRGVYTVKKHYGLKPTCPTRKFWTESNYQTYSGLVHFNQNPLVIKFINLRKLEHLLTLEARLFQPSLSNLDFRFLIFLFCRFTACWFNFNAWFGLPATRSFFHMQRARLDASSVFTS